MVDIGRQVFSARQFPKSSGYREDAATGIAAAALSFGLLENRLIERSERVALARQGWAMGRPSEIGVRLRFEQGDIAGYWLGGSVLLEGA